MVSEGATLAERYELRAELGAGGMGVVWRARDVKLARDVAVKILSQDALGSDVARARLIREARSAAALEHPGVVHVYDVGELEDGGAFLVMELVRGKSFGSLLDEGSLDPAKKLDLMAQVARALAFAHEAGIVHRDIKPDNIMVRSDGRAAVLDFGIAKPISTELASTLGDSATSLTREGQLVGTPAYLSPEQARGEQIGPPTDQFSLAVTTYEALSGKLPWTGATTLELIAAMLRDAPMPLCTDATGLPAEVDRVIRRALAKAPGDRYASMSDFAASLESLATSVSSEVPLAPQSARSSLGSATTLSASQIITGGSAAGPRRSRAALALAPLALAAIAGLWYAAQTRDRPKPAAPLAIGPNDVVACPLGDMAQMNEPVTFVAAAYGALTCERLQLVLGGPERALLPAVLSGAPGHPNDKFMEAYPVASIAGTLAAAKKSARFYVQALVDDNSMKEQRVTLVIRDSATDRIVASANGTGVEPFEAVRRAVDVLSERALPKMPLAAGLRELWGCEKVETALDLLDLRTALHIEDLEAARRVCKRAMGHGDLGPSTKYLVEQMCSEGTRVGKLSTPPPPTPAEPISEVVSDALARSGRGTKEEARARSAVLTRSAMREQRPQARALLFAAAAEVANKIGDATTARDCAWQSIQASPHLLDYRVNAWHRLSFASSEPDASLIATHAAWVPWEPVTQGGFSASTLEEFVKIGRRRLHLVKRGFYAYQLGSFMARAGLLNEAENIAQAIGDSLLKLELRLARAEYSGTIRDADAMVRALPADDASASTAFRMAGIATQAAVMLGKQSPVTKLVVDAYVLSEPPHIVDGVVPFSALVVACAHAPREIGKPCIERIIALRKAGRLPAIFGGADTVLEGALLYADGDVIGAARVWRPHLRGQRWAGLPTRELMAMAFDVAKMPELADELDATALPSTTKARVNLAWARTARRAYARGNHKRARELAERALEQWKSSADDIPAAAELRAMLAKIDAAKPRGGG